MKPAPLLLALTALAFAAAAGGCVWLVAQYAPGLTAGSLFLSASPVARLVMVLIVALILAALLVGGIGLLVRGPAKGPRVLLVILALACAALGGLAFLFDAMNIQTAVRAAGAPGFAVVAPSWAEALLAFSLGLFGALIAQGFHRLLARRPARP